MRTFTVALVSCVLLAACGGDSGGASGDHAGVYKLELESFKQMVLDNVKESMGGGEVPPEAMKMVDGMIAGARVDLDLKADGTYHVSGAMGGETFDESGTYSIQGTSITFTSTKKDGKDATEEKAGTIENGVVTVKPDDSMPAALRLVRK